MSWYNSSWNYRLPVSVNNLSGASTIDATVSFGAEVELFWDNTRADGYDIRFTQADGVTECAYNRHTWNSSTKTARFDVDAISAGSSDGTVVVFMYFGNSATTDGSTSPTISSAKTGTIELAEPGIPRVLVAPFRPGETIAQQKVTKSSAGQIDVWMDCRTMLQKQANAFNDSKRYEEIAWVTVQSLSGGSDDSGRYDESVTTISDPGWVKVRIKAGSSGTDYTLAVTIGTSNQRVIQARAIVDVQDLDES